MVMLILNGAVIASIFFCDGNQMLNVHYIAVFFDTGQSVMINHGHYTFASIRYTRMLGWK